MSPSAAARPHLLGVDDGPFEKYAEGGTTPIVGVMMEGADLVEAVAVTRFRVDGDDVSDFLADWIAGLRFRPALQGVIFGGITIAGLGVLDPEALTSRLGLPILVVNRRAPGNDPLREALRRAGHPERIPVLERAPRAFPIEGGLHVAVAGADRRHASDLVRSCLRKSDLPEPLRLAHLFARALVTGESRGRP
jgi:endonuclease V-like protein UPF0215 family